MAVIAKEFGVLPSVVMRDLAEDPEQLSLLCIPLLRYSEAKRALDDGNKTLMKAWEGTSIMKSVMENTFEIARLALEKAESGSS